MITGKSSSTIIPVQNWLDSTESSPHPYPPPPDTSGREVKSAGGTFKVRGERLVATGPYSLASFDYPLPKTLIAQFPSERRDESRLMVLHKGTGDVEHKRFFEIIEYLSCGDALVLNDTRVIPARLFGSRPTGGVVEVLLLEAIRDGVHSQRWVCLLNPTKGIKPGIVITFDEGLKGEVIARKGDGGCEVELSCRENIRDVIERIGVMPLPPYIKREPDKREIDRLDRERYQTVFARRDGAVAAPTAGLHFTEGLLTDIRAKGVEVLYLTLHTGWGTFKPVREGDIRRHRMLSEYYEIEPSTFLAIKRAKWEGRRVIAVGTTTTRALEDSIQGGWDKPRLQGSTDLYIYPGFEFKVVDGLITNFHLPRSTLLIMVSAFAGRDVIMNSYQEAIREGYRFFSYGDAMMIV